MPNLFILTLTTLLFTACCGLHYGEPDIRLPDCPEISIAPTLAETNYPQVAEVLSAELDGDCLIITGSFASGCVENDLHATAQRSALTVHPPIYVVTMYDRAEDLCEALETNTTTVDIAPILDEAKAFDLRFEGAPDLTIEVRRE